MVIPCGAAREVGLVLLALRVGEVGALIDVQREAEAALERAQVGAQDIRILGQINRLERELAQALATVHGGLGRAG